MLHLFVAKMNSRFEEFFNRFPSIRNLVRSSYHFLFETLEKRLETSKSDITQLERFYEPYNREFYSLLKQTYPNLELPCWIDKYAN